MGLELQPLEIKENIITPGYLEKQGLVRKSWKRRYFQVACVSKDGDIGYILAYGPGPDKPPLNILILNRISHVCYPPANSKRVPNDSKHFFVITSQRTLVVRASSQEEAKKWIDGISEALARIKGGKGKKGEKRALNRNHTVMTLKPKSTTSAIDIKAMRNRSSSFEGEAKEEEVDFKASTYSPATRANVRANDNGRREGGGDGESEKWLQDAAKQAVGEEKLRRASGGGTSSIKEEGEEVEELEVGTESGKDGNVSESSARDFPKAVDMQSSSCAVAGEVNEEGTAEELPMEGIYNRKEELQVEGKRTLRSSSSANDLSSRHLLPIQEDSIFVDVPELDAVERVGRTKERIQEPVSVRGTPSHSPERASPTRGRQGRARERFIDPESVRGTPAHSPERASPTSVPRLFAAIEHEIGERGERQPRSREREPVSVRGTPAHSPERASPTRMRFDGDRVGRTKERDPISVRGTPAHSPERASPTRQLYREGSGRVGRTREREPASVRGTPAHSPERASPTRHGGRVGRMREREPISLRGTPAHSPERASPTRRLGRLRDRDPTSVRGTPAHSPERASPTRHLAVEVNGRLGRSVERDPMSIRGTPAHSPERASPTRARKEFFSSIRESDMEGEDSLSATVSMLAKDVEQTLPNEKEAMAVDEAEPKDGKSEVSDHLADEEEKDVEEDKEVDEKENKRGKEELKETNEGEAEGKGEVKKDEVTEGRVGEQSAQVVGEDVKKQSNKAVSKPSPTISAPSPGNIESSGAAPSPRSIKVGTASRVAAVATPSSSMKQGKKEWEEMRASILKEASSTVGEAVKSGEHVVVAATLEDALSCPRKSMSGPEDYKVENRLLSYCKNDIEIEVNKKKIKVRNLSKTIVKGEHRFVRIQPPSYEKPKTIELEFTKEMKLARRGPLCVKLSLTLKSDKEVALLERAVKTAFRV